MASHEQVGSGYIFEHTLLENRMLEEEFKLPTLREVLLATNKNVFLFIELLRTKAFIFLKYVKDVVVLNANSNKARSTQSSGMCFFASSIKTTSLSFN